MGIIGIRTRQQKHITSEKHENELGNDDITEMQRNELTLHLLMDKGWSE